MSSLSTGYRHVRRAGQQGTSPPVLSQAGVEKYATGCDKLSMPSKNLDRLTKTHNLNKKNTEIKNVITDTDFFYKNKVYKNIRLRFAQILGSKNFKNHVRGSKKVSKSS